MFRVRKTIITITQTRFPVQHASIFLQPLLQVFSLLFFHSLVNHRLVMAGASVFDPSRSVSAHTEKKEDEEKKKNPDVQSGG